MAEIRNYIMNLSSDVTSAAWKLGCTGMNNDMKIPNRGGRRVMLVLDSFSSAFSASSAVKAF